MPYTPSELLEIDLNMFGCSRKDLIDDFERLIRYQSPSMGILSILSDVQELSLTGDINTVRLKLNQVKYLIEEYLVSNIPSLKHEFDR